MSRSELQYVANYTEYPNDGSRKVTRTFSNSFRIVFDDRLGGTRAEARTLSLGPGAQPGITVVGRNPQYTFQVDSERSDPFLISRYAENPAGADKDALWIEQLEDHGGLTPEDFGGASLLRLLERGEAKVTSASTVDINGGTCVRFDCNRSFPESPHRGPYPGWVIVDPSFHWAVRAYEQHFHWGTRRVSIEYNPKITDVAQPKRVVREDFGLRNQPQVKVESTYNDPRPSQAVANDFTLESFGLVRPLSKAQRRSRNVYLMILVNGGCLLALIGWFVLYRRAKQRTTTTAPPAAAG